MVVFILTYPSEDSFSLTTWLIESVHCGQCLFIYKLIRENHTGHLHQLISICFQIKIENKLFLWWNWSKFNHLSLLTTFFLFGVGLIIMRPVDKNGRKQWWLDIKRQDGIAYPSSLMRMRPILLKFELTFEFSI